MRCIWHSTYSYRYKKPQKSTSTAGPLAISVDGARLLQGQLPHFLWPLGTHFPAKTVRLFTIGTHHYQPNWEHVNVSIWGSQIWCKRKGTIKNGTPMSLMSPRSSVCLIHAVCAEINFRPGATTVKGPYPDNLQYCGWTKSCTTLKPREAIVCWYLQANHYSRVSYVVQDFVHLQ